MEQLNCFYHPNREAKNKCCKCGKLLCLECQKHVRMSSRAIDPRIYCPECENRTKRGMKISMFGGIILMIIMLIFVLNRLDII